MKIVVIGGGFAAQLFQLAVPEARLLDWRKTPPVNHMETRMGPQYLWEPIPGVPSESFPVTTLVDGQPPTPESILAYKKKIGKEDDGGNWGLQFQHESVGWESKLPVPTIEFGQTVRMVDLPGHTLGMADWKTIEYDILINTIPLPAFLDLMIVGPEFKEPFKSNAIFMTTIPKKFNDPKGMVLNYLSDPTVSCYRETRTPGYDFYEQLTPTSLAKKLLPGKIHAHPESELMLATMRLHDVHCFGRFATWRPDELAHETWHHIETWVSENGDKR